MVVLFIGAAVVCYFVWDMYFRIKDDNGSNMGAEGSSSEVVQVEEKEEKEEKIEENKNVGTTNNEVVEKEKVVQYEGNDPNEAGELTGAITYAGVSDGVLAIRVNIDQYLTDGECALTLARDGVEIYNDMASITGSVSTSSCDGFEVPLDQIGRGEVDIKIDLGADVRTGQLRRRVSV